MEMVSIGHDCWMNRGYRLMFDQKHFASCDSGVCDMPFRCRINAIHDYSYVHLPKQSVELITSIDVIPACRL